jgi:hypothetical protein
MTNDKFGMTKRDLGQMLRDRAFVIRYLSFVVLLAGCTSTNDIAFTPQIVVQGFLYANEPLDSIVVRQTESVFDTSHDKSINDALVTIASENGIDTLHLGYKGGEYIPKRPIIPRSRKTYTLRVEWNGQIATSTTTVPDSIRLDSVVAYGRRLSLTNTDTLRYPNPNSIDSLNQPGVHLYWTKSQNASGYGLEAVCTDTAKHSRFTYKIDPITGDTTVIRYDSGGRIDSKVRFEDTTAIGRYRFFILSQDEFVSWLQFQFYGSNVVRALAIDKNFQDYILGLYISRSQFNNNTLHVQGGLGIFGSAARASKRVFLE